MADPDLELWGEGGKGAVLFHLPSWGLLLQSFLLFSPKIRGARAPWVPPVDPPLAVVRQNIGSLSPGYNTEKERGGRNVKIRLKFGSLTCCITLQTRFVFF